MKFTHFDGYSEGPAWLISCHHELDFGYAPWDAWTTDSRSDAECVAAAMRILGYEGAVAVRVEESK